MCGKLDAVEKWKTKITFFFFSCVKLMRNYWVHVARHELLPYISLRWSVWLWQRWRAAYATVLITFMLIFFLKIFRYGWTYRCPADLAEPPCWMLRAPCMLHGGKGTLPSQRGRHRRDPFRWGCSGGMRTGSCAERSTAAVPGRNPASRGARSDRYRSPYLWRRTPAWSGNPWKPRWNHRPRGWRASSPRRQVRTARSFSGVYLAVVVSDRVCSELRSSTVWKLLTQSEACVPKLPWRSSQAVHRGGAQPN